MFSEIFKIWTTFTVHTYEVINCRSLAGYAITALHSL